MSVPPISAVGFTPLVPQTAPVTTTTPATGTTRTTAASGPDFGQILANGIQQLQGLHTNADQLAVKAATGDLTSIHDYTIAATEASVATQLTTAVRNKALEAFQEIMRMSI
jgi:flagellar hook-basal body complex protein FliE